MGELTGIYAIWLREVTVFLRQKSRLLPAIIIPLLWLFVFGVGFAATLGPSLKINVNYIAFIFPGMIMVSIIFSSVFFGINIVWDKRLGFLKEVLVAPISKTSVFLGKVLGGTTNSMIQIIILFVVVIIAVFAGIFHGLIITPFTIILSLIVVFLAAISMVGIGLIIGSLSNNPVDDIVRTFLMLPMFLLSGALFPLSDLPHWLSWASLWDPMTYFVDILRNILLRQSQFSFLHSGTIIIIFVAIIIGVGVYLFKKMKV